MSGFIWADKSFLEKAQKKIKIRFLQLNRYACHNTARVKMVDVLTAERKIS